MREGERPGAAEEVSVDVTGLSPSRRVDTHIGRRQSQGRTSPRQSGVQPRGSAGRPRTPEENLAPVLRSSLKKKTWNNEASHGSRASRSAEAIAADAAASSSAAPNRAQGGGSSSSSSTAAGSSWQRGMPPPCPLPLAPTSLKLHERDADDAAGLPCRGGAGSDSARGLRAHFGGEEVFAVRPSKAAAAAPEEAPEVTVPCEDERLERAVSILLDRLQWHLEATQASTHAVQNRIDKIRAALESDALERALEAALERVLPGLLQRAAQALPKGDSTPSSALSAKLAGLPGSADKSHGQLRRGPPDVASAPVPDGRGWGTALSVGRLGLGWSSDGDDDALKLTVKRPHKASGSGSRLAKQEPPPISPSLVSTTPKAHSGTEENPRFMVESMAMERLRERTESGTGSSGFHVISKVATSRLDEKSNRDESSVASAGRRAPPQIDVDMAGAAWERDTSDEEGDEARDPSHWSPTTSSDGHLALGQWGGRASRLSRTSRVSAASSFMSKLRSGGVSADLDHFTFLSRLKGGQDMPSRVRSSFRSGSKASCAPNAAAIASEREEDVDSQGEENDEFGARKSNAGPGRPSRPSTLVMERTRSQERRSKDRLSTRKARLLQFVCTFLVVVNAIWVGARSHYVMRSELIRHGVEVQWGWAGLPSYSLADRGNASMVVTEAPLSLDEAQNLTGWGHPLTDAFFTLLFIFEFCLRIWLYGRWEFILGEHWRWNVFDSILIAVTGVHWFVNVFLINTLSVSITRLPRVTFLRILRLPRVAIDLSHLDSIHSLGLMTASILHSLTFSWVAFSVVICIIYLFSVCFVQGIIDSLEGAAVGTISDDTLASIAQKFGSVQITILSLFQAISGGIDWVELMVPLQSAPWRYTLLLFFYIFVVVFGVLNIVTSMFVECVCQVTKEDYKERIRSELLAQKRWIHQLKKIFVEADEDESGSLSWNEFSSLVNAPMMRAYFTTLELNIEEAKEIFEYLDVQGEGEVNMQDFIRGCVCLRGEAKSVDVAVLRSQWQRTSRQLTEDMRTVTRLVEQQQERLVLAVGSHPASPRRVDQKWSSNESGR